MGNINIRNHHQQNAAYFRVQQNFPFLCIHSQRNDSCITALQEEDAEYRGRVSQLSGKRQPWFWHREVQPNYLGLEERSFPQGKLRFTFCILGHVHFALDSFIFTTNFLLKIASAYSCYTFESYCITLVLFAVVLAFFLLSAFVAQVFVACIYALGINRMDDFHKTHF